MIRNSIWRPDSETDFDVTVIVAVKNGADTLEACLCSILSQEGLKVGMIVVDGNSTDGTLEIIEKYRPYLSVVLYGATLGVYDAWNRALKFCNSPWIAFLGCDDRYSDPKAISKLLAVAEKSNSDPAFIYSKVSYRNEHDEQIKVAGSPWHIAKTQLAYRMSVHHGGALHARKLFVAGGFDTSFRITGDYELLYRQREQLEAAFLNEPIVLARLGGLSTRSDLAISQKLEVRRIFRKHHASVIVILYWYIGMCATLASITLSKIRNCF